MILWGLFAADYCVRLYLAPRRLYFITHNLMNLAIVLLPAWRIVSFLAMIHLTANRQYKRLSELGISSSATPRSSSSCLPCRSIRWSPPSRAR